MFFNPEMEAVHFFNDIVDFCWTAWHCMAFQKRMFA
jgi:hypothetical protein